jgi:hypothetical protein
MGLIGNILANAAAGGVEGGGEGAAKEGELAIKAYSLENHERVKQQLEGEREQRNLALKGEQERPLREAHGRYFNALADSVDRGERAKGVKPTFPHLIKSQSADGSEAWMDQNVPGAIGTIVPAVEGKPEEKNWIFPNKPAVAGKPANMMWSVDGVTMDSGEYRRRFYGDANPVSGRGNDATAATPTPQSSGRPPLTSFFPSAQAAPARAPAQPGAQANAQPQAQPAAQAAAQPGTPAPAPVDQTGGAVDAARAKLSAAQAGLQRFGLMQQKRDPQGYAAAQQAVAAARQDLDTSMSQYQNELGPVGAATPPLRVK